MAQIVFWQFILLFSPYLARSETRVSGHLHVSCLSQTSHNKQYSPEMGPKSISLVKVRRGHAEI
jgi:hypothetical protein